MTTTALVLGLGIALFALLVWGYRTLPNENRQMLAALPLLKSDQGEWTGLNLTWYGLLSANAYTFGVAWTIFLAASAGIPLAALILLTLLVLGVTIPASKILARLVEKKTGTLTVGGAVFAGVVAAPWLIILVNQTLGRSLGVVVPVFVMMACLSIGYTFGEALGRLACLSFGCCYGKPLCQCSAATQKLFANFHVIYTGKTKKVAYASGMDGEKMIPIQIITAVIYTISGLAGTWLFLEGMVWAALIETLGATQIWRVVSEFFRADYRGEQKFSMYQVMALGAIVYTTIILFFFPASATDIHLEKGLEALWQPGMILFLQGIWLVSFLHSGRSTVTGSRISFHVVDDRI